ncbi:MAG: YbaK/EbsC family protein [Bacteroidota bacterium]
MPEELSPNARKIQDVLAGLGLSCQVVELPASTRTAQEAAQAIGCRVEQIVKSLVFQGRETNRPILVMTGGGNCVNETRLAALSGEPVQKADADFVRAKTGYAIGGVPPVGHVETPVTFIDEDLLAHGEIWAAAGTPNAVFKLTPADLRRITGGRVAGIK